MCSSSVEIIVHEETESFLIDDQLSLLGSKTIKYKIIFFFPLRTGIGLGRIGGIAHRENMRSWKK